MTSLTRRRLLAGLAAGAGALARPARARAAEPIRIGLVLPREGASARQARLGAEVGLREGQTFAELFDRKLELLAEEAGTAAEAARQAEALVRKGRAVAVAGALDDLTALALREVAAREGALVVNLGARGDDLRGASCHPRLFHVQPSDRMYLDAVVTWLAARRKVKRFGLVAEEDARGVALRAPAAAAVAAAGGQVVAEATPAAPARAAREGAEAILLALPSPIALEVIRAAKGAGLAVPLAGAGLEPEAFLEPDVAGAKGVFAALWYHETARFSARELNRRFRDETKQPMQGVGWCGWAAVRLLAEAAVRAERTAPAAFEAFLASDYPFDGHKGEQLTFRPWDRQLRTTFVVLSPRAVAPNETDLYETLADNHPRDLDAAGVGRAATRCRIGG